jgi:cytochrome c-type biogenesis protein CcmH
MTVAAGLPSRWSAVRRSATVQRVAWAVLGVVVVVAMVVGWQRASLPPRAARIAAIEADVKCPSCEDLSVAVSTAPTAKAVRQVIVQRVDAGASTASIEQYLIGRYGPSILLRPPTSGLSGLVWEVPLAVAAVAVVALGTVFWRRRSVAAVAVDDRDDELVRRALQGWAGHDDTDGLARSAEER